MLTSNYKPNFLLINYIKLLTLKVNYIKLYANIEIKTQFDAHRLLI